MNTRWWVAGAVAAHGTAWLNARPQGTPDFRSPLIEIMRATHRWPPIPECTAIDAWMLQESEKGATRVAFFDGNPGPGRPVGFWKQLEDAAGFSIGVMSNSAASPQVHAIGWHKVGDSWSLRADEVGAPPSVESDPPVDVAEARLRSTLEECAAFEESTDGVWGKRLRRILDDRAGYGGGEVDARYVLPLGLLETHARVVRLIGRSAIWGGMGGWSDRVVQDLTQRRRHEELGHKLCRGTEEAWRAVVNDPFWALPYEARLQTRAAQGEP